MGNPFSKNPPTENFSNSNTNQISLPKNRGRGQMPRISSSDQNLEKDDEPLVTHSIKSTTTSSEDLEISLKFCRNYLAPSTNYQEWPCTLTFQAPENAENQRSGVDIICIIDVSGSMRGDKMALVQKTLQFMLTQVTELDRVSIVAFNNTARKLFPLIVMNERGKTVAENAINLLGASGGTNIVGGLDLGLRIAANRKVENNSTAIILLSDGCDNEKLTAYERSRASIESFQHLNFSYTIHSFGYGADHDATTLSVIAELKNGGFYYVEKFETIAEAFANCLGELLSAIANEVSVSLTTLPSEIKFALTKVYSSNGDIQFTMPNIMYGDTKEAVFLLGFSPSDIIIQEAFEITPIRANVFYTLVKSGEKKVLEADLKISVKNSEENVEIDESVLVNFYRVKTAEVLKEASVFGDAGKMDEAKELLRKAADELRNCVVANSELLQILIKDLEEAKDRFVNVQAYEHGGRAHMQNKAMGHREKRGERVEVYQNVCQKRMQLSSKSYFGS